MYDKIKELELQVRDLEKEVAELSQYKEETIWRLTDEDFKVIMDSKNLSPEQQQSILSKAYDKFSLDDWMEYVELFIDVQED